ncbi:MAG: universal stress protein [Promethearchaeota archaeon]
MLVGVDESQDAMNAVKKALELKKRDNSEVVVFHSVNHHYSEYSPNFSLTGASISFLIHEDYINIGKEILKKVEELFTNDGQIVETRLIIDVPPESYIKNITEEEDFDLIILGCNGKHSKLRRTFLGTIPNNVINNTSCDVLIVR